jgi:hypothetical protein
MIVGTILVRRFAMVGTKNRVVGYGRSHSLDNEARVEYFDMISEEKVEVVRLC